MCAGWLELGVCLSSSRCAHPNPCPFVELKETRRGQAVPKVHQNWSLGYRRREPQTNNHRSPCNMPFISGPCLG